MKVVLLFALVFTLSVVHGHNKPCQQRAASNAYSRFVGRHIVRGCFNRRSRSSWGWYVKKSGLCNGRRLTFIESRDQARLSQICNGSGRRFSYGSRGDLCTSSSRFLVYEVKVDCRCRVRRVKQRRRFVIVACDLVRGCCLPTRFERSTCRGPNWRARPCR